MQTPTVHLRQKQLPWFVRTLAQTDWWMLFAALALLLAGCMSLFSIDYSTHSSFFRKHLLKLVIGIVPFLVFLWVKPRKWIAAAPFLYVFSLGLLTLVMFAGQTRGGAQRWIQIGSFDFQPSEFAKLTLMICLAAFYHKFRDEVHKTKTFLMAFAIIAPQLLLIYKQPHLGGTLVVMCLWLGVSLAAGVPAAKVVAAVTLILGGLTAAFFIPGGMDDYQRGRILGLFHPDDKKDGYQTLRAAMAFANGGVNGTGYLKGDIKAAAKVPEQESDFIITVVGEEGGLIGSLMVVIAFGILFFRLWWGSFATKDPFHSNLLIGILCILVAHTFANLGMVMRIFPVVGLWLPFMSFGGTSAWLCLSLMGLALNIRRLDTEVRLFD